eukprot:ANDGO_05077.mRNA.1 type-like protein
MSVGMWVVCAVLLVTAALASAAGSLTKLNIEANSVTVSGISAGAFSAVQFHVAYSKLVKGAGVVAGGPFYCAQGQVTTALTTCMAAPAMINVASLESAAKDMAKRGAIDPIENIKGAPVFIFSGSSDTVVQPGVVKANAKWYTDMGADVQTEFSINAQHSQVTNDYGSTCQYLGKPFVNNCNFDAAGAILNHVYGTLGRGSLVEANLKTFDQSTYFPTYIGLNGLGRTGYIYIPTACSQGESCKLHFALHGCSMRYSDIGDAYVLHGGYNQWAEASNIVVVYPQFEANMLKSNPNACSDWFGTTGSNYAEKGGVQNEFFRNIVTALAGF